MDTSFLPLLACPQCRGNLALFENQSGLSCAHCRVVYPVEHDIPLLLKEEAVPLARWECRSQGRSGGTGPQNVTGRQE